MLPISQMPPKASKEILADSLALPATETMEAKEEVRAIRLE